MTDEPFLPLLIKVMGLTTSDNDGTSLVAIRKANMLLSKHNTSWEMLLLGKVKIIADPFTSMPNIPSSNRDVRAPRPTPPPRPQAPPPPPPPRYAAPPPPPRYTPPPPPPPPEQPAGPNKFEGTCRVCGNKVAPGDGLLFRVGSRWKTEHRSGQCPPKRKKINTFTSDDLQI